MYILNFLKDRQEILYQKLTASLTGIFYNM